MGGEVPHQAQRLVDCLEAELLYKLSDPMYYVLSVIRVNPKNVLPRSSFPMNPGSMSKPREAHAKG